MRYLILLLSIALGQTLVAQSILSRHNFPNQKHHQTRGEVGQVIIQAGQSIAAGRASIDSIESPYLYLKDTLSAQMLQGLGVVRFDSLIAGVNNQVTVNQHGSEIFLADTLARLGDITYWVGQYNVVDLFQGAGTDWHPNSTGEAFDDLVTKINQAKIALGNQNKRSKIKGLIWIHGGQDATDLTKAQAYQSNLELFVQSITPHLEGAPILIWKIVGSNDPTAIHYQYIRDAVDYVSLNYSNVYSFDLIGIPVFDGVHPSWIGHILMGREMLPYLKR